MPFKKGFAHFAIKAAVPVIPVALSGTKDLWFRKRIRVIIGMPLNFANIIALPLLLGIGVAFDIYFVMNWRAGRPNPLQSGTARAIVFSALTTTSASRVVVSIGRTATIARAMRAANRSSPCCRSTRARVTSS